MESEVKKQDVLFLLACLGLGLLAEISFLRGRIGLSYLVFITSFYLVVFLRFRLAFNHRRIGLLMMAVIWILSGSYLIYDNTFFYHLNKFIVPLLVLTHLVLITSPNTLKWDRPQFISLIVEKLLEGRKYRVQFLEKMFRHFVKGRDTKATRILRKSLSGIMLAMPLLLLVIGSLMLVDAIFPQFIAGSFKDLFYFDFMEGFLRVLFIILVGFVFFGLFQVVDDKSKTIHEQDDRKKRSPRFDRIMAITILSILHVVYLFFLVTEFNYLFGKELVDEMTYARNARNGFFELIGVIVLNWTVLLIFLNLIKEASSRVKLTLNILYTLLISISSVMLVSAYQRLSMYEAAYGFTLARILAHAFMLFLMVVFVYTLITVWMKHLSLIHFYIIIGLIFYAALNMVNIDQVIVDKNIERFEQTGKIDIYYLNTLSYIGWDGLVEVYGLEPDYPDLQKLIYRNQQWIEAEQEVAWQSFNFPYEKIKEKLSELVLKEDFK